jgi:glycine/D-amino acid oxidase-like deaminating enzyme
MLNSKLLSAMSPLDTANRWGTPPWEIDFTPPEQLLPRSVDFAIIGGGFTGLAAAAWLRLLAADKSVMVLESGRVGGGASGRTGGIALAETATGDLPQLGDVLAGFQEILAQLGVECGLSLPGAWEIARSEGVAESRIAAAPIRWNDSGVLRVVREVPGGTLDPGRLVSGLARAGQRLGVLIFEHHRVAHVDWQEHAKLELVSGGHPSGKVAAAKVLFATNALSLSLSGLDARTHPKLTLATLSAPLTEGQMEAIGMAGRRPFYTVDFPYLWGRTRPDNSIVWGAGLVDAPESRGLEQIDIASEEPSGKLASLEKRVRNLHPELAHIAFTHRWGGPILFRDEWRPVFDWHPENRNGIVLGAYAGHGVALASYLGAWAAEVLLGRRGLPGWGAIPG